MEVILEREDGHKDTIELSDDRFDLYVRLVQNLDERLTRGEFESANDLDKVICDYTSNEDERLIIVALLDKVATFRNRLRLLKVLADLF